MNLYELTQEFATAMQAITVDPETGEVSGFEVVDGLDAAFEDKAEAYAVTIKNLDAEVKALKNERDNLKAREDAGEHYERRNGSRRLVQGGYRPQAGQDGNRQTAEKR